MAVPSKSDIIPTKTHTANVSDTIKSNTMPYNLAFIFSFIACTLFLLFHPSSHSSLSSSSSSFSVITNIVNLNLSFLSSNTSHSSSSSSSSFFSSFFPNNHSHLNITRPTPPFAPLNNVSNVNTCKTSNLTQQQTRNNGFLADSNNGLYESLWKCDLFDGKWVTDESYPLYDPGSCPHIDDPFNCFLNGRPDNGYEKYRWQPNACNIPRLNGTNMLELLRGKRLVFVGDSLNRNMWESLVCILRNSVEDKTKVFEASGKHEFRKDGFYSFIFRDYNCSIEFFRSPFLVQEWQVPGENGTMRDTLRLDLVESQSDQYKDADVLIFNTGHWWTHEKTLKGQGYYQEGSHVYGELDVNEAFRRAVVTWARWVDASVNRTKTQVIFRGYSSSHFSEGTWNTGGKCDNETEPFKNDMYLLSYPHIMEVLENVIDSMKMGVFYLNITRLTDYRKDAHPAVYRAQNLSEEERRASWRYQDCSHWCLPGVPDTWNELLYAQVLISNYRKQQYDRQNQEVNDTANGHR